MLAGWYLCVLCVFTPAMIAHTTVDSGVKWSLCRGGHEVGERGAEGRVAA